MQTLSKLACSVAVVAGALSLPALALAQLVPDRTREAARPPITTAAIMPDIVAIYQPPGGFVEAYGPEHPCTIHSHTYTATIRIGRRHGTFPAPSATLYRDGQAIQTWTVNVAPGPSPVTLGTFTWSKEHPCPGGGTSMSYSPTPTPNYRLVVDPGNKVTEHSETNNVVQFHIDPAVPFVKAP
jgi:hypothetical protein